MQPTAWPHPRADPAAPNSSIAWFTCICPSPQPHHGHIKGLTLPPQTPSIAWFTGICPSPQPHHGHIRGLTRPLQSPSIAWLTSNSKHTLPLQSPSIAWLTSNSKHTLPLQSPSIAWFTSNSKHTLPLQSPSMAWFTSNSKRHWFTTSFLAGKRCSECGFTCICPPTQTVWVYSVWTHVWSRSGSTL